VTAALTLLLAASLTVSGLAQDYSQSAGYAAYRQADSLFVAKKVPEALRSLEDSLKLDPELVPALTLYAKIAMTRNKFEAARESLERALKVNPNAAYAQFLYGLNFYLTNDLQNALPQFVKARRLNARDGRAARYLGLTYQSLGRTGEAMAQYEESARLEASADTYVTGARLLHLMGRLDECERWIRLALKLEPDSRDAHFELARLLLRNDNPGAAAKEGEIALALSSGSVSDSQIHYLLIRAYRVSDPMLSARHAEAVRVLEDR
jgi:tetratricopeptide (TPR) repeat protein